MPKTLVRSGERFKQAFAVMVSLSLKPVRMFDLSGSCISLTVEEWLLLI
jgi:hypothetical protein